MAADEVLAKAPFTTGATSVKVLRACGVLRAMTIATCTQVRTSSQSRALLVLPCTFEPNIQADFTLKTCV
jgi:hypothetical protein